MSAGLSPQQVLGSYVIERELGRGGMGAIYLGVHVALRKRAAIKVLLPELSRREDAVARFWAEARAVTAIKHASIVDVYDYGITPDGRTFIVMEYLEGETLGARLAARGLLPIPHAVAITRQIANALAAAHAVGVVHRDLKPDNIFLVADPEVAGGVRAKLLDFGVAKLVTTDDGTAKTMTGALLGTPHYMSPEQCEGARAVDHRSDLYALGCTLFQMVSGRLPFESPGVGGLIGMHLHVPPPKLRDRAPHASEYLERVVACLLEKQPEARFASANELVAALSAAEASEVDAAASAPLPRQIVQADLATAVSRFDEPSVPPRIPPRITDEPPLSPLAPTLLAPATQRPPPEPPADALDAQAPIAHPARSRRTRWAWLAASVGLLGVVALAVTAVPRDRAPHTGGDTGRANGLVGLPGGDAPATPPDATLSTELTTERDGSTAANGPAEIDPGDDLAELALAMQNRQWIRAGQLAAKLRERSDVPHELVDRMLADVADQAAREMQAHIEELADNGDCNQARLLAMQFSVGWGKVANRAVRIAETCDIDDDDEADAFLDITAHHAEGKVSVALGKCKARPRFGSEPMRKACALIACLAGDQAQTKKWLAPLPPVARTEVVEGCRAERRAD